MSTDADIKRELATLSDFLSDSTNIVFFTGAGISTESGIPDYRSPGGIWTQMQPIAFQEFVASEEARLEDWRRRFVMNADFDAAEPNVGHRFISDMIGNGSASGVITQNIDGLHQRSGVGSDKLIELHGNATYGRCLACGCEYELDWARDYIKARRSAPRCDACGGFVKAAVISFGQAMPEAEMARGINLSRACDLFIVLGSSLQVFPAASLPQMTKENGARLIIINRDRTPLDSLADLVIHSFIGNVLKDVSG